MVLCLIRRPIKILDWQVLQTFGFRPVHELEMFYFLFWISADFCIGTTIHPKQESNLLQKYLSQSVINYLLFLIIWHHRYQPGMQYGVCQKKLSKITDFLQKNVFRIPDMGKKKQRPYPQLATKRTPSSYFTFGYVHVSRTVSLIPWTWGWSSLYFQKSKLLGNSTQVTQTSNS